MRLTRSQNLGNPARSTRSLLPKAWEELTILRPPACLRQANPMTVLIMLAGLSLLLAAWMLPMLSDHLPHRLQGALIIGGLTLAVGGAALWVRV
jgi:hypothetical protein